MTFKFALKAGCAALALAAGAAQASPFYIDLGPGNAFGPLGGQVNANSTSVKDQFTFSYDSNTIIQDSNNNFAIDAGDLLSTSLGFSGVGGIGALGDNVVTNFLPAQVFTNNSNNGYGTNWLITFKAVNLNGIVTGVTPGGVPLFAYGPGATLEMYITFDGVNFNNFMDVAVTGGGATGVGTLLLGKADFTNVDAGYNDIFKSTTMSCAGDNSYFAIVNTCNLDVAFSASQDTDVTLSQFSYDPLTKTFDITSNHDGSGKFAIPEPGSLALLGLGLAGLGLTQRRRKLAAK